MHGHDRAAVAMAEALRANPLFAVTVVAEVDAHDAAVLAQGAVDVALLPPDSDVGVLRAFQGDDTPSALLWTPHPDAGLERLAARLQLDGTAPLAPPDAVEAAVARALSQRRRTFPGEASRPPTSRARWMWDAGSRRLRLDAHARLPLSREDLRALLRSEVAAVVGQQARSFHHEHRLDHHGEHLLVTVRGMVSGDTEHASLRGTVEVQVVEDLGAQIDRDALTGLPGRASFLDGLEVAQERAKRTGRGYAVLTLDLDNLGALNDGLGHRIGDRLLRWTADRLHGLVPEQLVARIGNDEFAVLLPTDDAEPPEAAARRILAALTQAVSLDGHLVYPNAKAGLAEADPQTPAPDAPLRDALSALSRAKQAKTRRLVAFDGELRARHLAVIQLDRDLRHAIATDQLRLHFQPIVGLVDGRMHGVEALLRWPHPERGWVSPVEFVAHAERTGMILPLGRWVLNEACACLARVRRSTPAFEGTYVSVNLSPLQLHQPDLVDHVREALAATGLEPAALRLELTENSAMAEGERTLNALHQLRELGVQILIDDFGTGYSSLHYLARLPADMLKVDKSFIEGIGEDARKMRVVSTIVDLAESLGMRVIAEGVETPEQVRWLRQHGIDAAQGFLFGRPMPERLLHQAATVPELAGAPFEPSPDAAEPG